MSGRAPVPRGAAVDGDAWRVMAMVWGPAWGWLVVDVLMLLSWGLVIAAVAVGRYLGATRQGGLPAASSDRERPGAEELLDERFARDEIGREEYTRRRQLRRAGR